VEIMPGPDDLPDDLIDAALRADGEPRDAARLREAVLRRTVGVIRRRRRARSCVLAAALAGCYVAGLATASLRAPAERGLAPPAVSSPLPRPNAPPNRERGSARLSPEELARRDADRCLLDRGDVKEAVRGYDRFLKLASADRRAIAPEQDSWLLMALKDAKLKEMARDREKQN
jgi:hypothetical protein